MQTENQVDANAQTNPTDLGCESANNGCYYLHPPSHLLSLPPPQPFYCPFSGTTRVSRCQKRTSRLMLQGKINRGRHTDHLAGRHSIRINQCPPPSSHPIFFTGRMPFMPPNQQHQSTEGNASKQSKSYCLLPVPC